MTLREHADSLFALLSSKLGEGSLSLDKNGRALFSLGNTQFFAHLIEETETLLISALVEQMPLGPAREACLRELAQADFNWGGTGGGTIGLERETDLVYLHQRFFLPMNRPEDFPDRFAEQLHLTRHWAGVLRRAATPALDTSAMRV